MADTGAGGLRDIGHLAVWSVSSAKPGNGVELLRDGRNDTFWQSDGQQPHSINIQFHKKVIITEIDFYLDYNLDESYTPKEITVRVGTCFHDLKEIRLLDLVEPQGWIKVSLLPDDQDTEGGDNWGKPLEALSLEGSLKTFFVQVSVVSNCLKGRDTHIREIRVYGPRIDSSAYLGMPCTMATPEFSIYSCIR
eukprot:gene25887-11560_t